VLDALGGGDGEAATAASHSLSKVAPQHTTTAASSTTIKLYRIQPLARRPGATFRKTVV